MIPSISPSVLLPTSGQYSGNSTANRAIPHGLGVVPVFVLINNINAIPGHRRGIFNTTTYIQNQGTMTESTVTGWDAINFYVGNAGSYGNSHNFTSATYQWMAIG